eukprot:scaffold24837_cov84-Cyclotella_meneghiniana.AAC.3
MIDSGSLGAVSDVCPTVVAYCGICMCEGGLCCWFVDLRVRWKSWFVDLRVLWKSWIVDLRVRWKSWFIDLRVQWKSWFIDLRVVSA